MVNGASFNNAPSLSQLSAQITRMNHNDGLADEPELEQVGLNPAKVKQYDSDNNGVSSDELMQYLEDQGKPVRLEIQGVYHVANGTVVTEQLSTLCAAYMNIPDNKLANIIDKLFAGESLKADETAYLEEIVSDPETYVADLVEATKQSDAENIEGSSKNEGFMSGYAWLADTLTNQLADVLPILSGVANGKITAQQLQIDEDQKLGLTEVYFDQTFPELEAFCAENDMDVGILLARIENTYYTNPAAEGLLNITNGPGATVMSPLTILNVCMFPELIDYKPEVIVQGMNLLGKIDRAFTLRSNGMNKEKNIRTVLRTLDQWGLRTESFNDGVKLAIKGIKAAKAEVETKFDDALLAIDEGRFADAAVLINELREDYAGVIASDLELLTNIDNLAGNLEARANGGVLAHLVSFKSDLQKAKAPLMELLDGAHMALVKAKEEFALGEQQRIDGEQDQANASFQLVKSLVDGVNNFATYIPSEHSSSITPGLLACKESLKRSPEDIRELTAASDAEDIVEALGKLDRTTQQLVVQLVDVLGYRALLDYMITKGTS